MTPRDPVHVSCFNTVVEIFIEDVQCHEWDARLRPLSYQNSCTAVLCLSVDDPTSFENVESLWWPEIAHWIPEVPIILVGTKKDVSRKVSIDEVSSLSNYLGLEH